MTPALGQYYLRARYYDQNVGRFTQMDTWSGNNSDPITLHKYLYGNADPVNVVDPSGNIGLGSFGVSSSIRGILATSATGAVFGAGFSAVDAFLGGRDVVDAAIKGGIFGALLGPLAKVKLLQPVLLSAGVGLSSIGAFQAIMDDNLALAIFRGTLGVAFSATSWRIYGPQKVQHINPNSLRFSQSSAGGNGRAAVLRASMGKNGWKGPAVDAVKGPNGVIVIDNTRVAVARELGISNIPVRVHNPSDALPSSMSGRFGNAKTWGEALGVRTGRQGKNFPSDGSPNSPRMPSSN